MRTLVSTNSRESALMKLVTRDAQLSAAPEIVSGPHPRQQALSRGIMVFGAANGLFQGGGQQGRDRSLVSGGDDLHLLDQRSRQADGQVLSIHVKQGSTETAAIGGG